MFGRARYCGMSIWWEGFSGMSQQLYGSLYLLLSFPRCRSNPLFPDLRSNPPQFFSMCGVRFRVESSFLFNLWGIPYPIR
jgi:hypothetical protein